MASGQIIGTDMDNVYEVPGTQRRPPMVPTPHEVCAHMQAVADDCCQGAGQQHCVLPFDLLGNYRELEQAAAGAAAAFGGAGVDVLVHNAGALLKRHLCQPL